VALIIASSSTTLLTDDLFKIWGVPEQERLYLALLTSSLLSVLLLLLAEVTPKTLAIRYAERVALAAAARSTDGHVPQPDPVGGDHRLARSHGRPRSKGPVPHRERAHHAAARLEEQGVIEEQEHDMIHGIIEIGDKSSAR